MRRGGWAETLCILSVLTVVAGCGREPPKQKYDPIADPEKARAKTWAAEYAKRAAVEQASQDAADIAIHDAAPDCPADSYRFTPADELSIAEFSKLASESKSSPVRSADGRSSYRVAYAPFDYEDPPGRGEWTGAGVIYVRADPPDRRTIGGVLWMRDDFPPSGGGDSYESRPDGEHLLIEMLPRYSDPQGTKIACISRFRVTLSRDGVLTAGGRRIGQFR